jgi:hypothetical protein
MIYYIAIFIITLVLCGGILYTVNYYVSDLVYTAMLDPINVAGGLSDAATTSVTFMTALMNSVIILMFVVGWIWLFTRYQKEVGYGE